jgi:hypothetical protein
VDVAEGFWLVDVRHFLSEFLSSSSPCVTSFFNPPAPDCWWNLLSVKMLSYLLSKAVSDKRKTSQAALSAA